MDIEEVAHDTPEKIMTFSVDPATGIMPHHGRAVAEALRPDGDLAKQAEHAARHSSTRPSSPRTWHAGDQPADRHDGRPARCLDAKISFDANALYRHPDIVALRDETEEDAKEIEASKHDLSYIALDGTIGCMVNGAGLAMATHGHHQALRRGAGELPRRRRRRLRGEGDGGLQDHHRRPAR